MKTSNKLLELEEKYKNSVVLVEIGAFYIAVGTSAIILSNKLGSRKTCLCKNICKVNIPKNAVQNYFVEIVETGFSIVILRRNKEDMLEKYVKHMINVIIKLPRTEKFNIGDSYKKSMYNMLRDILYINRISSNLKRIELLTNIDTELNLQRIFLRIMHENRWIDDKKFTVAIEMAYEIGEIIGGLLKYYGKNNKE